MENKTDAQLEQLPQSKAHEDRLTSKPKNSASQSSKSRDNQSNTAKS